MQAECSNEFSHISRFAYFTRKSGMKMVSAGSRTFTFSRKASGNPSSTTRLKHAVVLLAPGRCRQFWQSFFSRRRHTDLARPRIHRISVLDVARVAADRLNTSTGAGRQPMKIDLTNEDSKVPSEQTPHGGTVYSAQSQTTARNFPLVNFARTSALTG
jgi:hypothetical protein